MERPRVSVIVPVFNRDAWLGEALDSIAAQTYEDYEVIIVDDGSTDRSREIALDRSRKSRGRIRVIAIGNSGVATARNTGLSEARGLYFAFLDSDDAWLHDHLERAVAAFEHDPDLGLVHANIERIDTRGRSLDVPVRHWQEVSDPFEAIALRHEHVACSTAVVAREAIEVVGKFDERFNGLGCEDRDLWLRIADRFRIRYLDHVATRYRVHPTSLSADLARMHQARRLLIEKLGRSERGRDLVAGMEAMIESDLGLEYLMRRKHRDAIRQQWLAIRLDPTARLLWKRLARVLFTSCLHGLSAGRASLSMRGAR
jgi:glycosyltransferase involved in cell wall biosynthesis